MPITYRIILLVDLTKKIEARNNEMTSTKYLKEKIFKLETEIQAKSKELKYFVLQNPDLQKHIKSTRNGNYLGK